MICHMFSCVYVILLIYCLFGNPPSISPWVPGSRRASFPIHRILCEACIPTLEQCTSSEMTAAVCLKEPPPLTPFAPACCSLQLRDYVSVDPCVFWTHLIIASYRLRFNPRCGQEEVFSLFGQLVGRTG